MLDMTYAPEDETFARRLQDDLRALPAVPAAGLLIAVLSPHAHADQEVQQAIIAALDAGEHIIPVIARPAPLPTLIDHLPPLDFSAGYDRDRLLKRIADLSSLETPPSVPVNARSLRTSNRTLALVLIVVVLGMFVLSLLVLGGGMVGFPQEEYATIDAEGLATRDYFIDSVLPRSTDAAANFPATVEAATTALRPFLIATATAIANDGQ